MSRHRQPAALRPAGRGPCSPAAGPDRRIAELAVTQLRDGDPAAELTLARAARACLPAGCALSPAAAAAVARVSLRRQEPPDAPAAALRCRAGAARHPCTGAALPDPTRPPATAADAAAWLVRDWTQVAEDVARVEARCWLGLRGSVSPAERTRLRRFALLAEP
jgi:hypothetical protein